MATYIGKFLPVSQYVYCEEGSRVLYVFPFLNTLDPVLTKRLGRGGAIMPIVRNFLIMYIYIQGVSRLEDITAGGDFLGLCDQ